MTIRNILLCAACSLFMCSIAYPQTLDALETIYKINVKADTYGGNLASGEVRGTGNVRVTTSEVTLTADKIVVNLTTGKFQAEGTPVKIAQKTKGSEFLWTGNLISGNLNDKVFNVVGDSYASAGPYYISAGGVEQTKDGKIIFKKGKFSTCNHLTCDEFCGHHKCDNPFTHWYMGVSEIEIERVKKENADGTTEMEEWITLKHPVLKLYGVPIFYWPWAMFQRDWLENIRIQQGQEEDWGYFVKASYKTAIIKNIWDAAYEVEHYQKRGEAFGMENAFRNKEKTFNAGLLLYWLDDRKPIKDYTAPDGTQYNARYETRSHDRYRINGFSRYDLADDLTMQGKVAYFSDNDLMYEYRTEYYNIDPEPNSYLDFAFLRDTFEASVNYTPQVNSFYTTLEKLPEVRFDMPRQKLGESPVFYQSQNAIAELRMNFRDYDLARFNGSPDNSNYSSTRFDSTHMFYTPITAGWLNILPRAGLRLTWYDRTSERAVTDAELQSVFSANSRRNSWWSTVPATPFDSNGGERTRVLAEYGMEMNFKSQAEWDAVSSELLGIDGLTHTIIPYINYILIPEEAEGDREHIYFFDEADRINEVNMLRVGIDQNLRTNKGLGPDRRSQVIFRMENYFDYYPDPEKGLEREGDLGTEIEFTPVSWFGSDFRVLYDSHDLDLNVLESSVRAGAASKVHVNVSYFFRNDYQDRYNYSFGSDMSRLFGTGIFPLAYNENHSVTSTLTMPVGSNNTFIYTHSRDLIAKETSYRKMEWKRKVHCWSFSLALYKTVTASTFEFSLFLTGRPKSQLGYSYDYESVED